MPVILKYFVSEHLNFMAASLCHSLVPHTNVDPGLCFVLEGSCSCWVDEIEMA